MARKNNSRNRLYSIVSILVTVVVLFCITVSWDEKNDGMLGLPAWSHDLSDTLEGVLDDFTGEDGARSSLAPIAGELADAPLEVHFLDVGQAESILIKAPSANVLIDAGENNQGEQVLRYLRENGVHALDYALGTHPHSDHIGGLDVVVGDMAVENVILPTIPDSIVPTTQTYTDLLQAIAARGLKITPAKPGKTFDLGDGAELLILGPAAEYNDLNNMSIVCRLKFGGTTFLLTGDAETPAENDILAGGRPVRADVLGVGHHGSATSSGEDFLTAVSPGIAVISCGMDNSYGHPHRETIERLETRGIEIFRTDLHGAVVIASDGEQLSVTMGKETN